MRAPVRSVEGKRTLKIVGGVFVTVGLAMLAGASALAWHQVTIIRSWPETEGVVTRSEVREGSSSDSSTAMYSVRIEFRYRAAGREYISPAPSDYSTSSYPSMRRRADSYPVGSRHTIKYNPDDANDIRASAGYTPGFFFAPMILGFLGLLFSIIGGTLAFAGTRIQLAQLNQPNEEPGLFNRSL